MPKVASQSEPNRVEVKSYFEIFYKYFKKPNRIKRKLISMRIRTWVLGMVGSPTTACSSVETPQTLFRPPEPPLLLAAAGALKLNYNIDTQILPLCSKIIWNPVAYLYIERIEQCWTVKYKVLEVRQNSNLHPKEHLLNLEMDLSLAVKDY